MGERYIYLHNPRCSKSRMGIEICEESGNEITIREYLKEPLSQKEIESLLMALGKKASEVIRSKEKIISEEGINIETESDCFQALVDYPILLERPILWVGKKAIIGRPPEDLKELL